MIRYNVFLDARDLADLTDTGVLPCPLADGVFELYTRPRPTSSDLAVRLRPQDVEKLRATGLLELDIPLGQLVVSMQTEDAR